MSGHSEFPGKWDQTGQGLGRLLTWTLRETESLEGWEQRSSSDLSLKRIKLKFETDLSLKRISLAAV